MKHRQTILASQQGRYKRGLGLKLVTVSTSYRHSSVWVLKEIHSSGKEDLLMVLFSLPDEE